MDSETPACWDWPITRADLDAAEMHSRHVAHVVLWNWQQGQCATCGREGRMYRDHDHATGLLRGLLCRSCNSQEGFTAVAVPGYTTMHRFGSSQVRTFDRWHAKDSNRALVEQMRRYRLVNPASRLGLRVRHVAVLPRWTPVLPHRYEGPIPVPTR